MSSSPDDAVEAHVFADVLRDPHDPRWPEAYAELDRIVRQEIVRHRRALRVVQHLGSPEDSKELSHLFWLELVDRPDLLRSTVVQGWGLVRFEIRKFLSRADQDSRMNVEIALPRIRRHFESKVRQVLRSHYQRLETRRLWGRAGLLERAPMAQEIESARQRQPPLPADWVERKKRQTPPVCTGADLAVHLGRIFDCLGTFAHVETLAELSWVALLPPAAAIGVTTQDDSPAGPDGLAVSDGWRDFSLSKRLQAHFDAQNSQTQSAARQAFAGFSLREMTPSAGSRAGASRNLNAYYAEVKGILQECGYTADDAAAAAALRDILAS